MDIQLIKGQFNSNDAIEIITQLLQVKIKYHEQKINGISNEEDIKNREAKIKNLQKNLYELRILIDAKNNGVNINATINID